MAASECATAPKRTAAVLVNFLVLVSIASQCSCQGTQVTLGPGPSSPPATLKVPTVPPVTAGPPIQTTKPAHTVAPPHPTAGLLCGDYQTDNYDLTKLVSADYWTVTLPGACIDNYDDKSVNCTFSFAFCKQLPKAVVGEDGVGASQVSNVPGVARVRLGGLSEIVQNRDDNELFVRYRNGETTECSGMARQIQVEMHLHCNEKAHWLTPTAGSPGLMPSITIASWDKDACVYTVVTEYDGACILYSGLSAGTIIIIIFFCLLTVYLIGGVIFNKMAGAKGLELIPNYEMWKMFPSDVMGGFAFVWQIITCRGMKSKSEVYDDL